MKNIVNYIKENWDILLAWAIAGIYAIQAILLLVIMLTGEEVDSNAITSANNAAVAANNAVRVIVFG
jgi:hypothetical protein